ncbi:MAG: methyltransferase family protein [Flavisolibacter sp.]
MEAQKGHPGVYIPPPLLYAAFFFAAILLEKFLPFSRHFFLTTPATVLGIIFIAASLLFNVPALRQFFQTKNTLVTIRPAHSLQTTGIYAISRNPMYVSLFLLYVGLAFLFGNWWNFIVLPLLIVVIQQYVIRREECYLDQRFGEEYLDYKARVRRWL